MIRAILNALRNAIASLSQGIWWAFTLPFRVIDGLLGGGGGGTVMPKKDLALPNPDEIEVARAHARRDVEVADKVSKWSLASQARCFAMSPPESRYEIDISMMSPDQQSWLQRLSETDLRIVAEADDKHLNRALTGENFALRGIDSVGCDTRPVDHTLADRIRIARAARAERDNVFAA